MYRYLALLLPWLLIGPASCKPADPVGALGDPGGGGSDRRGSGGNAGTDPGMNVAPAPTQLPPTSSCKDPGLPGPRVLRRLSAPQFNATVQDLFKDRGAPSATFLNDPPVLGFDSDAAALVVQDLTAQQLMDFAEQVATWADAHLGNISTCMSMDQGCRRQFIQGFGQRAFRAPLSDARVAAYDTLMAAQPSFAEGAHLVVQAMLQSPYFLYRRELGTAGDGGRYRLTPYEIASNLSYLLVGSMPDDALMQAAASDQLATTAQIDAQTKRLLQDPRSQELVARFMTGWLGLDRVLTAVKDDKLGNVPQALRQSMLGESRALILDTMFQKDGSFADVLTADHTFLDGNLAQYYGLGNKQGAQFQATPLAGSGRDPGILAHAGVLTGYASADASSPVQRGKLVRTRLLCQQIPPPPANLSTKLSPPSPAQTTRQRYEEHDKDPTCAGCHRLLDPVGFAFEHYDALGKYRDQENGIAVDAHGSVVGAAGGDAAIDGLASLAKFLAADDEVNDCLVRYWSYAAYGIAAWDQDGCTRDAIRTESKAAGDKLQAVLLALTHAPHFTSRVQDR